MIGNVGRFAILCVLSSAGLPAVSQSHAQTPQTQGAAQPTLKDGTPFTPEELQELLPPSVYFQGKTAPLQIRNSGGARLAGGGIFWAAKVDTSGYATGIQEKYQFYLVTEQPVLIGEKRLGAGAYGGGFVGQTFLLMDLGGHTLAEGATEPQPEMKRPRPLQVLPGSTPAAARLCLGRQCVTLQAASGAR